MAIKKSIVTGGNARQVLHAPFTANVPAIALVEHVFKEGIAAGDILEIAILPAYCRILSAEIMAVGVTNTVDVGLMTGDVFSDDPARIVNDVIFDGTVLSEEMQDSRLDRLAVIQGVGVQRSIGVLFPAAVTPDIAKRLTLRVTYAAT